MKKSTFKSDLRKEQRLSEFVDTIYSKFLKNYHFERISNIKQQLAGIDVNFTHKASGHTYHIDEKAQLDYLNEDLPTFAFELSYLKEGKEKIGWLFDTKKRTDFYALVTALFEDEGEFSSCKVTLVNRQKLISMLSEFGFNAEKLQNYKSLNGHGKIELEGLHPKTQGYLYHSKNNKAEQPLNLILKLDWLIEKKIARRLI